MKKNLVHQTIIGGLTIALMIGLVSGCNQTNSKSEEDLNSSTYEAKAAANADIVYLKGKIGNRKINKAGTYIISGKVEGNLDIDLNSGNIVLKGEDASAVFKGIPRPGAARHVSHIQGSINNGCKIEVKDFKIEGDTQNAMEFGGNGSKLIENIHVINYTRVIDGKMQFGAGCINAGENSKIINCHLETGDDAIKITEPNSAGEDSIIEMHDNGTAIQFGWGNQASGDNHIAKNITIKGQLKPNPKKPDNSMDPGRSIIGGAFENNVKNIQVTGLKIYGTKYGHVIKLVADQGATIENITITGQLLDGIKNYDKSHTAIVLIATQGSKIKNCKIDLGPEAAKAEYHYIKGDVDVEFVK